MLFSKSYHLFFVYLNEKSNYLKNYNIFIFIKFKRFKYFDKY